MKSFFEGIASLFVDFLFVPMDMFRELELSNWWTANVINWMFIIICLRGNELLDKAIKYF